MHTQGIIWEFKKIHPPNAGLALYSPMCFNFRTQAKRSFFEVKTSLILALPPIKDRGPSKNETIVALSCSFCISISMPYRFWRKVGPNLGWKYYSTPGKKSRPKQGGGISRMKDDGRRIRTRASILSSPSTLLLTPHNPDPGHNNRPDTRRHTEAPREIQYTPCIFPERYSKPHRKPDPFSLQPGPKCHLRNQCRQTGPSHPQNSTLHRARIWPCWGTPARKRRS